MMLFRFLLAFFAATSVVTTSSLVWYKVTTKPRPEALTKIKDAVVATQPGSEVAGILGVGSDAETQPVNIASAASQVISNAVAAVEEKGRSTVVVGIAKQVMTEVDKLPDDQKNQVKEQICK